MKKYLLKMVSIILIISSIFVVNNHQEKKLKTNEIDNILLNSSIPINAYEQVVYEDLTFNELALKINNVLNSTLDGYAEVIIEKSLDYEVDPVVAASIILVETGCKWKCSYLARVCNNVGGMKGKGCGSYQKFASLDSGIESFIKNLSRNYYQKGLNTPEKINQKYAENPNWYKDVYYYVNEIKAS